MPIYLICEVNSLEKEGIQDDENKKNQLSFIFQKPFNIIFISNTFI